MTDTPIVTEPGTEKVASTILQRIAVPTFSFSFVLFVALLTSQYFILPTLTTFRVGEVDVTVDEAIAYERQLRAELVSLEDKRQELVLPHIDPTLDDLMRLKRATPSIVAVQSMVESAMRVAADASDASVTVDAVLLDAPSRTVTVRGAVIDPRPSSMATLAAAVDAVRALPTVTDVVPPVLTREHVAEGYRSPFRFTFVLQ